MITADEHVDAPSAVVWDVISDLPAWAERLETVDRIDQLTDGGPGQGARYRIRQPGLPAATYAVTSWVPGQSFTWVSSSPALTTTATHEILAAGPASTLRLGIVWSGPLAWLARLMFARKAARYIGTEGRAFARLAEQTARERA